MMKRRLVLAAMFAAASVAFGFQNPETPLWERARSTVQTNLAKLPRYVCTQTVRRSRAEGYSPSQTAQGRLFVSWQDQYRLDITVSDGVERYSWPQSAGGKSADSPLEWIGTSKLTSTGDFSGFLRSIFSAPAPPLFVRQEGADTAVFRYQVTAAASNYHFLDGGRAKAAPALAYEGEIRLRRASGRIAKLTIVVPKPPSQFGAKRLETTITYAATAADPALPLLPEKTLTQLWDRDGALHENRTAYGPCRVFAAESTFRADEEPSSATAAQTPNPASGSPSSLPNPVLPGALADVTLTTPINSETSFAGDLVEGTLVGGMRVRGRILAIEHHHRPIRYVTLRLRFDTLVSGTAPVEVPVALAPVAGNPEERALGQPGTKLYRTDYLQLEPGAVIRCVNSVAAPAGRR